MEKVNLYVKKILALLLSFSVLWISSLGLIDLSRIWIFVALPFSLLVFAYLDYRITGDKPRFLFGMNQSDAYLNKKGGFWNLFKWIVTALGFAYDMVIWVAWGVFLVFMLFVDLLMLVKFILFWIIHAVIWLVRQFFPPLVFLFRMFMHYIIQWTWWIYQLAFRNVKISVNRNFYFISLWGAIPALFIIFLFYAISQWVGIPQLVLISAVFAIIPLVWSYGEIAALRFEEREKDEYSAVKHAFRNGFDAVRSVLFYIIVALVLVVAEIVLNMVGWIPNLSMSFLGISLNLNMAISLLLVFLVVIIAFADCLLPSHILYQPGHNNDVQSSLAFLKVIGRKFLRYTFAHIPAAIFGAFLLVIPLALLLLTYQLTDSVKDGILETRIEHLEVKADTLTGQDAHVVNTRIQRMTMYKDMPLLAPGYFESYTGRAAVREADMRLAEKQNDLDRLEVKFNDQLEALNNKISMAETSQTDTPGPSEVSVLSGQRVDLEADHIDQKAAMEEEMALLGLDRQELKRLHIQMPILYFFVGILFAIFGGLVLAVIIAYLGNIYFELYNFREDEKPTYWKQTLDEIREENPNQPLLGFTFIAILVVVLILVSRGIF